MEELKPCPFCGSEAEMRQPFRGWYKVRCTNRDCHGTTGRFKSKQEAARAWNRRSKRDK